MPRSLDDIAIEAAKRKAAQAALLDLQHGAAGTSKAPLSLGEAMGQGMVAEGAAPPDRTSFGLLEGMAGIGQAGLDLGSHLPGALGRASGRGSEGLRKMIEGVGKTMPPAGIAGQVGESVGEMIPGLLMPGGAMTKGLLAGATQFQPSPSEEDRETSRAVGAGVGGVMGKVGDLLGQGITKALNSRQINKAFETMRDNVSEMDPALAASKGKIDTGVQKKLETFQARGKRAVELGDAQGPIDMTVGGTADKLQVLKEQSAKLVDPNTKGRQILDNVVSLLTPARALPKKLVVGGREFKLDLTGQYLGHDGTPLNQKVVDTALEAQNVKVTPDIRYSQLKATIEELDHAIEKADPGNGSTKLLQQARSLLVERAESAKTPAVRQAEIAAKRFYDKNLAQFDKPAIQDILRDPDPLTRTNKALEIALGNDPKVAKTVADLIGPKGVEGVRLSAIKKALDEGFDKKTGQIDAVKFHSFFDNKVGLRHFFDRDTEKMLQGSRNLLRDDALRHGESPAPSLSHPSGSFGLAFGMSEIMRGKFAQGAGMMASAALVGPTFKYLEKMMVDKLGRNLLVSASRAKPQSPRMAHLVQAMTRRFGAVAGAETGQIGGQP